VWRRGAEVDGDERGRMPIGGGGRWRLLRVWDRARVRRVRGRDAGPRGVTHGRRTGSERSRAEPRAVKPRERKFLRTKFVLHFILFSSRDHSSCITIDIRSPLLLSHVDSIPISFAVTSPEALMTQHSNADLCSCQIDLHLICTIHSFTSKL
jgi:hypothetical protein